MIADAFQTWFPEPSPRYSDALLEAKAQAFMLTRWVLAAFIVLLVANLFLPVPRGQR